MLPTFQMRLYLITKFIEYLNCNLPHSVTVNNSRHILVVQYLRVPFHLSHLTQRLPSTSHRS